MAVPIKMRKIQKPEHQVLSYPGHMSSAQSTHVWPVATMLDSKNVSHFHMTGNSITQNGPAQPKSPPGQDCPGFMHAAHTGPASQREAGGDGYKRNMGGR